MSTYLFVSVKINDPQKFQAYAQSAGATMAAFNAKTLARGKVIESICGENQADIAAVVEFDSTEQLKAWYASSDYQALIALRDEAADVNLAIIE